MRNKLVFPNGGTENKYVWDRYSLTNEGQHTWDKNKVVESTVYTWDKYAVNGSGTYTWDIYTDWYLKDVGQPKWLKYTTKLNDKKKYWWEKYKITDIKRYVGYTLDYANASYLGDEITANYKSGWIYLAYIDDSSGKIKNYAINIATAIKNNLVVESLASMRVFAWYYVSSGGFSLEHCNRLIMNYTQGVKIVDGALQITGNPLSNGKIIDITGDNFTETAYLKSIEVSSIYIQPTPPMVFESDNINAYPNGPLQNKYYLLEHDYVSILKNDGAFQKTSISANQRVIDTDIEPEVLYGDENAYTEGYDDENNCYYIYMGYDKEYESGNVIYDTITSTNRSDYPEDGFQLTGMINVDGFKMGLYYKLKNADTTETKGEFIEQITSNTQTEYPTDGIKNGFWYIYKSSQTEYIKGDFIEKVYSNQKNTYPQNDIKDSYYYVYKGYENQGPYKHLFIDEIETNDRNSYPDDGINGNYWYVFKKGKTGYKVQILDNQIIGGINYQHNINPQSDLTIGNVGMAKVDFTYDNTNDDFQQYIDLDYFLYYTWQKNDSDWRLIGKFYIDDVNYSRTRAKITAYDSICKAEKFVDDFIEKTTFPLPLQAFYTNLLTYLGLENGGFAGKFSTEYSNLNYNIKDNFQAINITGRQILQYIAEMVGGFCIADKNGRITIRDYYASNAFTLNNSQYKKYEASKFKPSGINSICAKMNSDDLGTTIKWYGQFGEEYIIENNPLFYTESEDEIKLPLTNLLYLLDKQVQGYTPGTIELLEDFGIVAGDKISINGNTFYVMSKTMSASGCKLECFGNKQREKQAQSINSEIVALRGKTNELVRDLDKTQSTLTDTANGLQSQITQTADEIRSEVISRENGMKNYVKSQISQTASQIRTEITDTANGLQSQITQTADKLDLKINDNVNSLSTTIEATAHQFSVEVSDNKKELESKIQQTADSITSTVSKQGQTITEIRQDLDGISLTYNSEQGTASITIGDITISELVDGKYVDRVVAGIDFSGYCRFSDLSTPGQTIICGDNITTGTISADRIELTGSISWGDLSDSCQDTIASFAGSGGSGGEVPSYIKSTYIDATTIKSPTIYGAKIYAGTSAEGYIKLASTGMNFYSNSGGSVCGIGYYPGKYNLPYIMLGQGVDDAGTDKGMIKKYTNGIWIGDSDNASSDSPGGTGIFINFTSGTIQKYINGSVSTL